MSDSTTHHKWVGGHLLGRHEIAVVEELKGGDDTAYSISVNIGPDGWTIVRALSSLEARGLVERYVHDCGLLAWRLTERGRGLL